jgi:hypothetical protein
MHHELIKSKLSEFRTESDETYDLKISDLVMMQMIGDFDDFLKQIEGRKTHKEIQELIEDTRKKTTTEKLFPGIVEKTIEAQFGEKHAALRELVQNAVDSYDENTPERLVRIGVSEDKNHLELTVRDYGVGMDLSSLVRDLLIPYNSGKEFDPTKIGEHGIGWYSIVDISPVVRVATRAKNSTESSCALIYRDEEYTWKTSVIPSSSDGFKKDFDCDGLHGTEVRAYIPKTVTDKEKLSAFLHQYVGTIDFRKGRIEFDNEIVNSVSDEYQRGTPVPVVIKGVASKMVMAVSKRLISGSSSDKRFKYRNENLSQVIFTQRGLFVKYSDMLFDEKTIHFKLANDLISVGLDFWVDLPSNVTLTKGRNNIIADHVPPVIDGMYRCFEGVFLDVLLNDDELIGHPSNIICNSVSEIFDKTYKSSIAAVQKREYTLTKRIIVQTATNLSLAVDVLCALSVRAGKAAGALWNSLNKPIPIPSLSSVLKFLGWLLPRGSLIFFIGAFTIFLVSLVIKHFNLKYFLVALSVITGLSIPTILIFSSSIREGVITFFKFVPKLPRILGNAALYPLYFLLIVLPQGIKSILKSIDLSSLKAVLAFSGAPSLFSSVSLKGIFGIVKLIILFPFGILFLVVEKVSKGLSVVASFSSMSLIRLLNLIGLYTNIEERKEKKRAKKRKKISRKYLTGMYKDGFLKKIMNKKIIPAVKCVSNATKEAGYLQRQKSFMRELFEDCFCFWKKEQSTGYLRRETYREKKERMVFFRERISVDDLIDLYLSNRLVKSRSIAEIDKYGKQSGDVVVYEDHPLVKTVTERLSEISIEVRRQYNVQLFEDHLENVMRFATGTFATFYFFFVIMSPIFLLIILTKAVGPHSSGYYYQYHAPEPLTQEYLFAWHNIVSFVCTAHFFWMLIVKETNVLKNYRIFKLALKALRLIFKGIVAFTRKDILGRKKRRTRTVKQEDLEGHLHSNRFHVASWQILQDVALDLFDDIKIIVLTLYRFLLKYPFLFLLFLYKKGTPWCAQIALRIVKEGPGYIAHMATVAKKDIKERIKRRIEARKADAATKTEKKKRKAEEKKRQKEMDKEHDENKKKIKERILGQRNFFTICYHTFLEWYEKSWLFGIIGYGEYKGSSFDRLGKERVEAIVKTTGAARSYLEHLNVLEKIDSLICEALRNTVDKKISRYKFTCAYDGVYAKYEYPHQIMTFFKKKKGEVTFNFSRLPSRFICPIMDDYTYFNLSRRTDLVNNRRMLSTYVMFIFDMLLHMRTHSLEKPAETGCEHGKHRFSHAKRKFYLSKTVCDYLSENNIDIEEVVKKELSSWTEDDPLYHVSHARFSQFVKMTYRRLKHEAYNLEVEKDEMIKTKNQRRKEKEAAGRLQIIRDRMKEGESKEMFEKMLLRIKEYSPLELADLAENDRCPFEPEHVDPNVIDPFSCEICGALLYPGKPHPRKKSKKPPI